MSAPAPAPVGAVDAVPGEALEILATGPLCTVQDHGRPHRARIGVPRSGALDRQAYALGNRLVGNVDGDAALEITGGGLVVRAAAPTVVALTGAPAPVSVDGRGAGTGSRLRLPAGAVLRVGTPTSGLRIYLAVRGGVDVDPVLGSRSTDMMSGLGPPVLRAGDRLPVGAPRAPMPGPTWAPAPVPPSDLVPLSITRGPRDDWFTAEALARLTGSVFVVTADSNRVGIRLAGPDLPRERRGELLSEGTVEGSLQIPSHGRPTLFLADHPVTGGYPVIGVIRDADLDIAAQLRPGQAVRFGTAARPRHRAGRR